MTCVKNAITRREFLWHSLEVLCAGIIIPTSISGCINDKEYHPINFRFDYGTSIGIGIQMPSWIEQKDYSEVGDIVDKYVIDFHYFLDEFVTTDYLRLIIPERIKSFESSASYTGCAAGVYYPRDNAAVVAWGKEGDTPYPARKNILPALPHELSHRWLQRHRLSDLHEDFPRAVIDADACLKLCDNAKKQLLVIYEHTCILTTLE